MTDEQRTQFRHGELATFVTLERQMLLEFIAILAIVQNAFESYRRLASLAAQAPDPARKTVRDHVA